jgi:formylglycine-generating enzyme required for sulfatase activity/Tol biopolymer transport system component
VWGCAVLVFIMITLAGCARHQGPRAGEAEAAAQSLPVVASKTGGELVLIPASSFIMGDGSGRPDETPHSISVDSFYLDRFLVRQELYEKVMGNNPSKRKAKTNPVERTQWTDAVRFCNKCSELEGLTPCYDLEKWECNFEADGYRLPTEAEWEYACRAGSEGKYSFGDSPGELARHAWFKGNSQGATHPVGQKQPNAWGLFDMHGNVWQWCNDFYSETYYLEGSKKNPRGPATGKMRVLRGGAWDSDADKCRAGYRFKEFPVYSDACFGADSYGFRRARKANDLGSVAANKAQDREEKKQTRESKVEDRGSKNGGKPSAVPDSQQSTVASSSKTGKLDPAQLKGTIVFVSDRSGTLKIWTMQASGKDPKQLTKDQNPDADPRFSPDGRRIIYTSLRGGFPEIWMMNRDGSDQRTICKGCQGSWSPDVKAILFIRDNQAYTRELESGKEKRVTPDNWERCGVPAWSPDGKRLAVASRHLGDIGIFLLSVEGKEVSQLKAQEPCCTPQWSRDGKRMLCQTVQGHIHQINLDGSDWEQMTFGADVQHDARYSPDDSMILFCRAPTPEGPWQICVKSIDGDESDFVQLTKEGSNLLPDWHADE